MNINYNLIKCDENLRNVIVKWFEFLQYEKHYSQNTLISYFEDLSFFIKFFSSYFNRPLEICQLNQISRKNLRDWLIYRREEEYKDSSTSRAISTIRSFFKFMMNNYEIENIHVLNLKKTKIAKTVPKALSVNEVFKAIERVSEIKQEEWISLRDIALLKLIYGCGLRISEALSVKIEDLQEEYLVVKGKGNKVRIVPTLTQIIDSIYKYYRSCPYINEKSQFLFYSKTGKKLSPPLFQKQIRALRDHIGLASNTTPHSFRHSFATHLLNDGADLRSIQELLGHDSLTSTEKYTKIDSARLKRQILNKHPRS